MNWLWQLIADGTFVVMFVILVVVVGVALGRLEVFTDEVRHLRREVHVMRDLGAEARRQGLTAVMEEKSRTRLGMQDPPPGGPT